MGDKGLLQVAFQDLRIAKLMIAECSNDDAGLNNVAYHCQQATEKICKHLLASKGIRYTKTHLIDDLLNELEVNSINYPKELDEMSFTMNRWSTVTRYNIDRCSNIKTITKALTIVENWYNIVKDMISTEIFK